MKVLILLCSLALIAGIAISVQRADVSVQLDMLEVNRIIQEIENDTSLALLGHLPESDLQLVFVPDGQSLHAHIQNRDTIIPIQSDGYQAGSLVIINHTAAQTERFHTLMNNIFYVQLAFVFLVLCYTRGIFIAKQSDLFKS